MFGTLTQLGGKLVRCLGDYAHHVRPAAKGRQLQPQAPHFFEEAGVGAVLKQQFGSLLPPHLPLPLCFIAAQHHVPQWPAALNHVCLGPTRAKSWVIRGGLQYRPEGPEVGDRVQELADSTGFTTQACTPSSYVLAS